MQQPEIGGRKSVRVELNAGEAYYYCTCGQSRNQPFCDGSHLGTAFKPQPFQVDESKVYALCACKRSAKPPFCDGSHRSLPEQQQGD